MAKYEPNSQLSVVVRAQDTFTSALNAATHPDPKWFKKLTLRRGAGLTAVWLMAVFLVPMFIVVGVVMGAIKGMGTGLHEGVMEAWRTLARAYELAAKD